MENLKTKIESNMKFLTEGGLWTRGDEIGRISVDTIKERYYRVLFYRLSTYRDTSSSLTHRILYDEACKAGLFPDIGFLPPPKDARVLDRNDIPWIFGTAIKEGPYSFDMIGISNSTVQELINLPTALQKSGIPLSKKKRMENENLPIIILGGANSFFSSALLSDDPLVDAIFTGGNADDLQLFFKSLAEMKAQGLDKNTVMHEITKNLPVFLPEKPRKIIPNRKKHKLSPPDHYIVHFDKESTGTAIVPISEGCPYFCSFCAESYTRKPYTEYNLREIISYSKALKNKTAADSIDLFSFNFNIHTEIERIIHSLHASFHSVGLKSQRFDFLGRNPEIIPFLKEAGKTSYTCGMEGISQRIRNFLAKSLNDKDLFSSMENLIKNKIREIKIFLIATGIETEKDYAEFDSFVSFIKNKSEEHHPGIRIVFSLTPLVRFPMTPLEFNDGIMPEEYTPIIAKIMEIAKKYSFEFRLASTIHDYFISQVLLRSRSSLVMKSLIDAIKKEKFVYYDHIPQQFSDTFRKILKNNGLSQKDLLKGTSKDEAVPWNFLETGINRDFLHETYEKCVKGIFLESCFAASDAKTECLSCGACGNTEETSFLISPKDEKKFPTDELSEIIRDKQRSSMEICFTVSMSKKAENLLGKYIASAIAIALMKTLPECADFFVRCRNKKEKNGQNYIFSILWKQKGSDLIEKIFRNNDLKNKLDKFFKKYGKIIEYK